MRKGKSMIDYKIKVNWQPTLKWLERIKAGTGDARPLWAAMIPRIRTFVKDEFAGGNPNKWGIVTGKQIGRAHV